MEKTNYHSHTAYCNHAVGSADEIIKAAYEEGYKVFCISEHIHHKGRAYNPQRTSLENEIKLFSEIRKLKKEYKGKMEIYCGLECEAFPDYYKHYQNLLDGDDVDYLILGHHNKSVISKESYWGVSNYDHDQFRDYIDSAISALKTNLFSCMAHPMAITWNSQIWSEFEEQESIKLIKAVIKLNIPFGLNLNGLDRKKNRDDGKLYYPHEPFFRICGELNAKVILENDSHSVDSISDSSLRQEALEIVKKYNLNLITRLEFKKGNKQCQKK